MLHQIQIDNVMYFPHEHPYSASSWNEREDYIHRTNDKTKSDFEKADKDGDGKIDEKEFADMMKSGMAIPKDEEEKPKEKKKSGEYDIPPPPKY